jgi:hypothetical protein
MASESFAEYFGPPVFVYSRAAALADGTLHNVTEQAAANGIILPTAVTDRIWQRIANIPETRDYETTEARLNDVLLMAYIAMRNAKANSFNGDTLYYNVIITTPNMGDAHRLKCHIGPGDNAEPVITIMDEWED